MTADPPSLTATAPAAAALAPGTKTRSARAALAVFAVVVVAAVPLYLWRGREQWFYLDEWDFLAGRSAASLHDLLRPHNEHWSTVPILAYRAMWRTFGLSTYRPYQLMTIGLHLVAACLLRLVMLRARVRPWIATSAAALFVFVGTGHENIIWAFQIGFVASLVCGLGQLILADHDGPFDRRDVAGVFVGGVGLMCSGVSVSMVAAVGIAVLIRRGWRMAALHVGPLAIMFLTWWALIGRGQYESPHGTLGEQLRVIAVGLSNVFAQLGQHLLASIALALILVGGLFYAAAHRTVPPFRTRAAATLGLLGGGVLFMAFSVVGRIGYADVALRLRVIDQIEDIARAGRYVHLLAACLIPALAIAADALMQRWKVLVPVFGLLFVVGIWGNINAIEQTGKERFRLGPKDYLLAVDQTPIANAVPARTRILGLSGPEVTMGWVRSGVRSGQIPTPSYSDKKLASVALSIALEVHVVDSASSRCAPLTGPVQRRLQEGASFDVRNGPVSVVLMHDGVSSSPQTLAANGQSRIVARAGPLDLRVSPVPGRATPAQLCD
jgi:hypothetical protein